MTEAGEDVKRSLPGWSLAREGPRPKKKQGWECPAPTVEDWEDYKKWKEEQDKKDELPAAPQFFLADTSLLFYQDPDVQLPWVHRLKCELPRRVGRLCGDLPVKASYIGFGTNDDTAGYEVFKQAMAQIGIVLCRQIHYPPSRFELAHLEQSDVILVGGGDRKRLWETLGSDLGTNQVPEYVKWRYLQGAVVIAVGEAMGLLGEKSWYPMAGKADAVVPFTGWKMFPHIVAPESEGADLEEIVEQLGGAGIVILGVSSGGGMIFNKDGLVEPVRHMLSEYRWDWQSKSVKQALLIGPPRGTGLICPLYAAMKDRDGLEDGEEADVWSYALTEEEEHDEEHLFELFDIRNSWLTLESRPEVETLKQQGNDAFKAGKADLAGLKYQQARVVLQNVACAWSQLPDEAKKSLTALDAPKAAPKLPSEKRAAEAAQQLGKKADYCASTYLTSLLLNLCACYLMAHAQDTERSNEAGTGNKDTGSADQSNAKASDVTTLVEVRNNLVEAFRSANEALTLSNGALAKAWYRRGCVFEEMRDPRNAFRDFEEALLRSPGDKAITKKRDEAKAAADKVAENMYYARHKELDAQERMLKLDTRRALKLQASNSDTYKDERGEFPIAQPLARLLEGKLEEIDGKPDLVETGESPKETAPYLHPQALWTWEFLVQRAPNLQLLEIQDIDLGAGPLEWLCKGLRTHTEIKVLRFIGTHIGAEGAKMMRNVIAQNTSLIDISLDGCALHDRGLDEIAQGLKQNSGPLESLSLKRNYLSSKKLSKLAEVFCTDREEHGLSLSVLDLSDNPLGSAGAREIGRIVASRSHQLRKLKLQNVLFDLAAFWRLVNNLNDERPLSQLDLRCNPIGRGTRRCWRSTMGPTIRCEVLLSDHPQKVRKEELSNNAETDLKWFPLPGRWV